MCIENEMGIQSVYFRAQPQFSLLQISLYTTLELANETRTQT
jgi:hypothetical protein